jgi:iron complex transport system substrate-binding protein
MKTKKAPVALRPVALCLALLVVFAALAGCGGGGAANQPTQAPPAGTTAPAAGTQQTGEKRTAYPLTITTYNYAKEEVQYTFAAAPERVYAQAQDNIEIMLALGLGDKIIGSSGLDGDIRADLTVEFARIPYQDNIVSKEEMLALEPDFITGWYSTFSEKRLEDVEFWHERGIGTYMALNSACRGTAEEAPRTIEYEIQDILNLGIIFDVQDRAEAIVAEIRAELKNIEAYLAGKERLTVAVLEDEGGTYRVYGQDVLGGDVAIAGGAALAVGKHGENGNIGAEDLIAANPDAIFMVWFEGYTVGEEDYAGEHVVTLITENPAFASLDAVKNGRVYAINLSGIYCSGMRTLDGVLDFARNLYPELYQ